MFNKLKEYFQDQSKTLEFDSSGKPTERELQIATGVILLQMAGADNDYAPEETKAIFKTLEEQFQIENSEAFEVLQAADAGRQAEEKIDCFVDAVNQNFTNEQRKLILSMIWKVILADYSVNNVEQQYVKQMQIRLQLSDEEAEEAKKLAQQGKV